MMNGVSPKHVMRPKAPRRQKSSQSEEGIQVGIRIRPLEDNGRNRAVWRQRENSVAETTPQGAFLSSQVPLQSIFTFDKVFDGMSTTQQVYEASGAKGIVMDAVKGLNGAIIAYGQTSSGKTFTMQGADPSGEDGEISSDGIIQFAAADLFDHINNSCSKFRVRASVLEVYNEEVRDLLDNNQVLKIHEDFERETFVNSAAEEIPDASSLLETLVRGEQSRVVGSTLLNERSSRSHTILQVKIESRSASDGTALVSTLSFVDLAGSERAKLSGASGERFKEGCHINTSLSMLSQVINALAEQKKNAAIGNHVFRKSKLTRLLQPALAGNAVVSLICCITPSELHRDETRSTLRFASRAKLVKTHAQVNKIVDNEQAKGLAEQQALIRDLHQQLKAAKAGEQKAKDEALRLREIISSSGPTATSRSPRKRQLTGVGASSPQKRAKHLSPTKEASPSPYDRYKTRIPSLSPRFRSHWPASEKTAATMPLAANADCRQLQNECNQLGNSIQLGDINRKGSIGSGLLSGGTATQAAIHSEHLVNLTAVRCLEATIEELKQDKLHLADELSKKSEHAKSLSDALCKLQPSYEQLKVQFGSAHDELCEVQLTLQESQSQNKALREDERELRRRITAFEEKEKAADVQLKNLTQELADIKKASSMREQRMLSELATIQESSTLQVREELQEANAKLTSENAALVNKIAEIREASASNLDRATEELKELQGQVQEQAAENQRLHNELARMQHETQAHLGHVSALKEQVSGLIDEKSKLEGTAARRPDPAAKEQVHAAKLERDIDGLNRKLMGRSKIIEMTQKSEKAAVEQNELLTALLKRRSVVDGDAELKTKVAEQAATIIGLQARVEELKAMFCKLKETPVAAFRSESIPSQVLPDESATVLDSFSSSPKPYGVGKNAKVKKSVFGQSLNTNGYSVLNKSNRVLSPIKKPVFDKENGQPFRLNGTLPR